MLIIMGMDIGHGVEDVTKQGQNIDDAKKRNKESSKYLDKEQDHNVWINEVTGQ